MNGTFYEIDSEAGWWNTGEPFEADGSPNLGYKVRPKGGYFPVAPYDHYVDLRDEMCTNLQNAGFELETRPPRGRHRRPGRDQLQVQHPAARRRRPAAVQVHHQEHRMAGRQDGHLHAQAAVRRQRLGHALPTSRCGRTAARCSTTSPATPACPTPRATTSAASCTTRRRCWRSPTRR